MRLRISLLLPSIYIILHVASLAACFASAGHGFVCAYAYYLLFPGGYIAPDIYLIGPIVAFILNVALYALVGYLLDKLLVALKR